MIQASDLCCGCASCAQKCLHKSIKMVESSAGFEYPQVDIDSCKHCGLCLSSCPVFCHKDTCTPKYIFAAYSKDPIVRYQSSSGGIFTLLAEYVLSQKGVVFGARFNSDWDVIIDWTEKSNDLSLFRGSKYVQAKVNGSYKQVLQFLKDGRKVLFSGTPCQIAGLKKYLNLEYENLLTVDFLCHGAPSPQVWRKYLSDTIGKDYKGRIVSVNFRDKIKGWKNFSFSIDYLDNCGTKQSITQPFYENNYMKVFLNNMILRDSCYNCLYRKGKSGSDITLGDMWGAEFVVPHMDDDQGLSLLSVNSSKGVSFISNLEFVSECVDYEIVQKYNAGFEEKTPVHPFRGEFFRRYIKCNMNDLIQEILYPGMVRKQILKFKKVLGICGK